MTWARQQPVPQRVTRAIMKAHLVTVWVPAVGATMHGRCWSRLVTPARLSSVPWAACAGADAELALVAYFQAQADAPPVSMTTLNVDKLNALVACSAMDLIG